MSGVPDKKPLQPRHWLLASGLAITLAATMWAAQIGDDEAADVQAVAGGDRRSGPAVSTDAKRSEKSKPADAEPPRIVDWNTTERAAWAPVTPAQLAAWQPPPPPAPPPPPPRAPVAAAAPMAPPFPYQLIGRLEEPGDDGKPRAVAFLSGPNRSLGVHAGEVIDGQWRVEQVGATGLSLTWLPAKLPQTIAFRPASPS